MNLVANKPARPGQKGGNTIIMIRKPQHKCAAGACSLLVSLLVVAVLIALVAPGAAMPPPVAGEEIVSSPPDFDQTGFFPSYTGIPSHPSLQAQTDTIKLSATLGTTTTFSITITNPTTTTITPLFYEAFPTPPEGAVPQGTTLATPRRMALPDHEARLDPQIMRDMATASDNQTDFLVFLHEQPDLSEAYTISDWNERGRFVYETLYNNARLSQRNMRLWLDEHQISYRPLWIVNAIEVQDGSPAVLQMLESRSDVAQLRATRVFSLGENLAVSIANCQPDEHGVCWNIQNLGANKVWHTFGVSGQGITVANIDSGVFVSHQALITQYRGYQGNSGDLQHRYNWYDATDNVASPEDAGSHGTHTMGTMVGRGDGSDTQPAVGVAPGAQWIAARGCGARECNNTDLLASAQWLLAPTDENGETPHPNMRPHIINNSWGTEREDDDFFLNVVTAWRAAGIFPVFAAGNKGHSQCGTIRSPGDYAEVLTVGSVDQNNNISYFSSVGPTKDGRIKPDIAAPGSSIASTTSSGDLNYRSMNGTSMATPHIAGAVALLWSANPALIGNYNETYNLLIQNATPRTDNAFSESNFATCTAQSVPNSIFGYGTANIYKAVEQATVDVPWLDLPANPVEPILPSTSQVVTLTADARQVSEPGTYEARVLVSSGDLSNPILTIPIAFTVTPPDVQATVSGTVYSEEGDPIGNSVVTIDISNGTNLYLGTSNTYSVTLPVSYNQPTVYTFTTHANRYVTQQTTLTLTRSTHIIHDILLLKDSPRLQFESDPLSTTLAYGETFSHTLLVKNIGTQPLEYTAHIPMLHFSTQRSDETDGPASTWIEQPAGAVSLSLKDDSFSEPVDIGFAFPFDNKTYNQLYIGSNGLLTFDTPLEVETFNPWCNMSSSDDHHLPETTGVAILPLRSDLNLEQGGSIWYGRMGEGEESKFVVSYENVSLFEDLDNLFTFQVILTPEGTIQLNYRLVGDIYIYSSNGLQLSSDKWHILGCGKTTPVTSGLTIDFKPQPATDLWLHLPFSTTEATTIFPGQTDTLTVETNWISPFESQPYEGVVVLETNDPKHTLVQRPIHLYTLPNQQQITFSGSEGADMDVTTSSGEAIEIFVPPGTFFDDTITLEYIELPPPTDVPPENGFVDHSFILRAYKDGILLPTTLTLSPSISITLTYDETNLEQEEEHRLMLYYKDTSDLFALYEDWKPMNSQLVVVHDVDNNQIKLGLIHLGKFALFYQQDMHYLYVPIVHGLQTSPTQ